MERSLVAYAVHQVGRSRARADELRQGIAEMITSADEIEFTRNVAEFATKELVAKRVKK